MSPLFFPFPQRKQAEGGVQNDTKLNHQINLMHDFFRMNRDPVHSETAYKALHSVLLFFHPLFVTMATIGSWKTFS